MSGTMLTLDRRRCPERQAVVRQVRSRPDMARNLVAVGQSAAAIATNW
ncbi:MAG: hypothetical protein ACFBSG_04200 [Leptolyngbyaceae cyanobacterium]